MWNDIDNFEEFDAITQIDLIERSVVNDSSNLGSRGFFSKMSAIESNVSQRKATSIAVCEHGTKRFYEFLRSKVISSKAITHHRKMGRGSRGIRGLKEYIIFW